ncbi:MAG: hypothetical protein JRJ31_17005 [Deltaproteobacteria bacterium]|nr:hypothetical protein [Deltaproteobacteria bacterium]
MRCVLCSQPERAFNSLRLRKVEAKHPAREKYRPLQAIVCGRCIQDLLRETADIPWEGMQIVRRRRTR